VHALVSYVTPQAAPELAGVTSTCRYRLCVPLPQPTEHTLHDDQSDNRQSTGVGHHAVVQLVTSVSTGDLQLEELSRARDRVWVSCTHVTEQEDQGPHSLTGHVELSSPVQGPVLQGWRSTRASQSTPGRVGATTTERCRCCSPPPHVLLHACQDDHADRTQEELYAHVAVLQGATSVRAGHAVPPLVALVMTGRERTRVPPPQDVVHGDQSPQSPTAQSTGQGFRLQGTYCCMGWVEQSWEPAAMRVLVCSCTPVVPHVALREQVEGRLLLGHPVRS
jgi:hypothetical protein